MTRVALAVVVVVVCQSQQLVRAQALKTDYLYVTGRADLVPSGGGEAGIDWLHNRGELTGVELGGISGSLADSWWTYGRIGAHRRWGRIVAIGSLNIGGGTQGHEPFGYHGYKGGVAFHLRPRVLVEGEGQYFKLGSTSVERLYRAALSWQLPRSMNIQLGYYRLLTLNGNAHAVSARLEMTAGRVGWLGGAVTGAAASQRPLAEVGMFRRTSAEYFAGSQIRVGSYQFLSVFDLVKSEPTAARILLGVRIPLPSKNGAPEPIVRGER